MKSKLETAAQYWWLPDDVVELMPEESQRFERLRQAFLQHCASWGYQQVIPPLVEFLDALLAGSGSDLERQTFKITDPYSGRLMGVRADITPQIARIDAHRLPTAAVSRYTYVGDVLRMRSESTEPRRNPVMAGAELYGVERVSGDMEMMALLLEFVTPKVVEGTVLDIGHAGMLAGLMKCYAFNEAEQHELIALLSSKQLTDIALWQQAKGLPECFAEDIAVLSGACLDSAEAIRALSQQFSGRMAEWDSAIAELASVCGMLNACFPHQLVQIDAAGMGEYGYHTGLVFALYIPNHYNAIARGGRYDNVGQAYGRARAATGFSLDLLSLATIEEDKSFKINQTSIAWQPNASAFALAAAKRQAGEQVIFEH